MSHWLWDLLSPGHGYDEIDPHLFAVRGDDTGAVLATIERVPDDLPPLPFEECWFEGYPLGEPLAEVKRGEGSPFGVGALHGVLVIEDQSLKNPGAKRWLGELAIRRLDTGDLVPILFEVDGRTIEYGTIEAGMFELHDLDDPADVGPAGVTVLIVALVEMATARGVWSETVIPPRFVRRGYERQGRPCPARAVLHIGSPRRESVSRGGERDWTCRWWVRGHWRQLAGDRERRRVWVRAHVKGPEDKPWRMPPPRYLIRGRS